MYAVQPYFQQLITRKEVSVIYVTDLQGRIIFEMPQAGLDPPAPQPLAGSQSGAGANAAVGSSVGTHSQHGSDIGAGVDRYGPFDGANPLATLTSNAVLSGAAAVKHLSQLRLGVLNTVSVQYRDYLLVQFVDGQCLVTLIGRPAEHHCLGGLLAVASSMKASPAFREMSALIRRTVEAS